MQYQIGTVPGSPGTNIGSPQDIPLVSGFSQTVADVQSAVFSNYDGSYYLIVRRSGGGAAPSVRLDNFKLEHRLISPPVLAFQQSNVTIAEGGNTQVCVSVTTPSVASTADVVLSSDNAPHLIDFTTQTLTFPINSTTEQCFTLQLEPVNGIHDENHTYTLELQNLTGGATEGTPSALTVMVTDDVPNPPEIEFQEPEITIAEGGSTSVCISVTTPSAGFTADVVLTSNADPHFTNFTTQTLIFPAGSTSEQCFTLELEPANGIVDQNHTYTFELQNLTGSATLGTASSFSVTVTDDLNTLPVLDFEQAEITLDEGGNVQVCVSITNPSVACTADVVLVGGADPHLNSFTTETLSFLEGSTTSQCFTLQLEPANSEPDLNLTYTLELQNMMGGAVGGDINTVTVTVTDDQAGCPWAGEDKTICAGPGEGTNIGCPEMSGTEGYCYSWLPKTGLSSPLSRQTNAKPDETTTYILFVTDNEGNFIGSDEVKVTVFPVPEITFSPATPLGCFPGETVTVNTPVGFATYLWSTNGNAQNESFNEAGTYGLTVTDNNNCQSSASIIVRNSATPDGVAGFFEEKGFYRIPVTILPDPPGIGIEEEQEKNLLDCGIDPCSAGGICVFSDIQELRFLLAGDEIAQFENVIQSNVDYFEQTFGLSNCAVYITRSDNVCADCPDFLNTFWGHFEANENSIWFNFVNQENSDEDDLFVLANIPDRENHLPEGSERPTLDFLRGLIGETGITDNLAPQTKGERVIFMTQLMLSGAVKDDIDPPLNGNGNPDPPYLPCGGGTQEPLICVAPSGIPIRVPANFILKFGFSRDIEQLVFPGALSAITDFSNGQYFPSVSRIGNDPQHEGYHSFSAKTFFLYPEPLVSGTQASQVILGYIQRTWPDANFVGTPDFEVPWVALPCPIISMYDFQYTPTVSVNQKTNGPYISDISSALVSLQILPEIRFLNSGCEPPVSFSRFNQPLYVKVISNPNNSELRWLFVVMDSQLGLIYVLSEVDASGEYVYKKWNCTDAVWEDYTPPMRPAFDISGDAVIIVSELAQTTGNTFLFVGGFIPVVGEAIDIGTAIFDLVQGNYGNAVLSGISLAMPFVSIRKLNGTFFAFLDKNTDATKPISYARKLRLTNPDGSVTEVVDNMGDVISSVLGKADELNLSELKVEELINYLVKKENYAYYVAFKNNPNLVEGWNILSELPSSVWSKVLNLEVANKLNNLGLHPNLSEAVKQIRKIIKSLDVAGDDGVVVLNKIKSGQFDNVQGYTSLLNKSADPGFFNALKQTMDKADEAMAPPSSYQANRLVFEDEVAAYDVDFGIKTVSGEPLYEKAFQLKSATTPNAVKNNLDPILVKRIADSPSIEKVYEIEMRSGTFSELENISNFWMNLNAVKAEHPNVIIRVKSRSDNFTRTY
ncbi:MAG: hypothetical protein ACKV1O_01440 [Saprospiraceae bacterium]